MIGLGPLGLLLLAFLDSAGIPMPGGVDALMVAFATSKPHEAYLAAALAVVGSLAGSTVLFFIARKGGEVFLRRQIESKTGAQMHLWFQRWGLATVFVPALVPFIPLPMKIPVFCAGALHVRLLYFLTVVGLARVIRYFALAYLAAEYGEQTLQFVKMHGWQVTISALVLAALLTVGMRMFQKHEVEIGIPE